MNRFRLTLFAFAVITTSVVVTAQDPHYPPQHQHDHDYWHRPVHVPSIAKLNANSDQLAKIARHLHADAHKLSQDYEHSQAIEHYVDSIDRLQQHMHKILHEATETGTPSTSLVTHVKRDVRQVKNLFYRLKGELSHQSFDGARTQDFHAMAHMREIINQQATPLLRQLEAELYGYTPRSNLDSFHQRPVTTPGRYSQRIHTLH